MQPIIHKAAIALETNQLSVGISPGDRARLVLDTDATISVFVEKPSRLPFGVGKPKLAPVGKLGTCATDILYFALERNAGFRVRISRLNQPMSVAPAALQSTFQFGETPIRARASAPPSS